MRALVFALLVVWGTAAYADDSAANPPAPATPPTDPANPNNASNPQGAPKPPPKWTLDPDQRGHLGECKKLTKQIARYERDAGWAHDRGNELWQTSSMERVYRLAAKREELCPSPKGPTAAELLAKAAVMAARLAALAASHGAF